MHLLAASSIPDILDMNNSEFQKCIIQTRRCLEGQLTEEEANDVSGKILKIIMEKWPEVYYKTSSGKLRQGDAAEFLYNVISSEKDLGNEVDTTILHKITCTNQQCSLKSQEYVNKEHINIASNIENKLQMSLQNIVDDMYKEKTSKCVKCNSRTREIKEIIDAPSRIILQVNRIAQDESKIETSIRCPTGDIYITTKGIKLRYEVEGAIIHKCAATENGHYVYNHFLKSEQKWIQIDDEQISKFDGRYRNRQATIFILKQKDIVEVSQQSNSQNLHISSILHPLRTGLPTVYLPSTANQTIRDPTYHTSYAEAASSKTPADHKFPTYNQPSTVRQPEVTNKHISFSQPIPVLTSFISSTTAAYQHLESNQPKTSYDQMQPPPASQLPTFTVQHSTSNQPLPARQTQQPNRHISASQLTSDMATVTIPLSTQPEEVRYHPEISPATDNIMKSHLMPTINILSTVHKHTKRYYMDRDDPSDNPKKICWSHKSDKCKFGENCWYVERDDYEDGQPFLVVAQQAWAESTCRNEEQEALTK